jgi:PAS domain S-box-containing protein
MSALLMHTTAERLQRVLSRVAEAPSRLAEILAAEPDPLIAFALDRTILAANAPAERFFAYAAHELDGQSTDVLVPDRFRQPNAPPPPALKDLTSVELPGVRKDGSELPLVWTYGSAAAPDGPIFVLVVRDRAELLAEVEALRRSAARYQSLLHASASIVWITDAAGEFVEPQPVWQEYTGQSWDDYRGARWISAIHPDDRARITEAWTEAVRSGAEYRAHGRVWSAKHAGWRAFQTRAVAVHDDTGAVVEWVGALTDVQDTVDAEQGRAEALAALTDTVGAVTQLQHIATVMFPEGSKLSAVLLEIVDAAISISGSAFGNIQLLDAASSELRIAAQRGFPQWWLDYWETVTAGSGTCGTALQLQRRVIVEDVEQSPIFEGASLDVQRRAGVRAVISTPIVSRSGKAIGMFSVQHRTVNRPSERTLQLLDLLAHQAGDLIERARAEDERKEAAEAVARANKELERASRAKDEFLATMSHELRTPLSSILVWASMLRRQPRDEHKLDRGLEAIERNARTQERIIGDLLDVSRIISGKLRLAVAKTALAEVVNAAVEVVRPAAESKGVRLFVEVAPDLPVLLADSARLQQVVWNLLINGVRFTPRGGSVTVAAHQAGSKVCLEVRDTGSGIPAEHLPHVFERFRQVDSSTTRSHGGLGLGLAIVRHIVEAHGGSVEAKSDGVDRGAVFTTTLPVPAVEASAEHAEVGEDGVRPDGDHAAPATSPTPAAGATRLDGMRVLVVEDDADTLDVVGRVLADAGAGVVAVDSAGAALDARGPFDLVVSDIGMPQMDGYTLMQRMRAREVGGDVPSIALTAYARAQDAEQARRAGYQEHLAKPIDASKLIEAVARWRRAKSV